MYILESESRRLGGEAGKGDGVAKLRMTEVFSFRLLGGWVVGPITEMTQRRLHCPAVTSHVCLTPLQTRKSLL